MKISCTHIPLLGDFGQAESELWLTELRAVMPQFTICSINELGEAEKKKVEVAIVANIEADVTKQLPNLRWVQSLWAGVDSLMPAIRQNQLKVVRMVDPQLAKSMSDSVLLWTMYLHQQSHTYRLQQQNAEWKQHLTKLPRETRVGILGLGNLGTEAAMRLKENGFKVRGWSRNAKKVEGIESLHGTNGLDEVLQTSGILVVLLPLTDQTRYLLNKNNLSKMPDGAAVINFARGAIIQTHDLLHCLDAGHLCHAVLDVFEQEPLPQTSPIWSHPKITVLPHVSAQTNPKTASKVVAKNMVNYFESGVIPEYVDVNEGY